MTLSEQILVDYIESSIEFWETSKNHSHPAVVSRIAELKEQLNALTKEEQP